MSTFSFTFEGTVQEAIELLSKTPYIKGDTRIVLHSATPVKVLTVEDRAREAARPFLAVQQKINAIKAVREITNLGLKEAKDFVEAMPEAQSRPEI